jgi:hypothetical protein
MKAIFTACAARLSARRMRPGSRFPNGFRLIVLDIGLDLSLDGTRARRTRGVRHGLSYRPEPPGRTLNSRVSEPLNKSRWPPRRQRRPQT